MAGRGTDILLGGNPEFLARSEMENEWIRGALGDAGRRGRRAAALRGRAPEPARDATTRTSSRRASDTSREWAPFEESAPRRSKQLTEADRKLRELVAMAGAPRPLRRGQLGRPDPGGSRPRSHSGALPARQGGDRDALLGAASRYRRGRARPGCGRAGSASTRCSTPGRSAGTDEVASELNDVRSQYERMLGQLEIALLVKGPVAGNGELAQWRDAYQEAERTYVEAERRHEAERKPFEEAVAATPSVATRRRGAKYTKAVEDIREEMEKAPQEFEARFRELLETYKELCAEEREQVVAAGGLLHHRHRAPREPAHRQPAARPRRPPGRSGRLALLPLARGRPAAHLRRRAHPGADDAPRHGGGRADRAPLDHPRHRQRAGARSRRTTSTSASTCSSTTT